MSLTEVAIRAARAAQRTYKVSDEKGLYLLVKPNGARLWRYKYRYAGIEKLFAIGRYPDVSLREARDRRDDARKPVASHVDPSLKIKDRAGGSREYICRRGGGVARDQESVALGEYLAEVSTAILSDVPRRLFGHLR